MLLAVVASFVAALLYAAASVLQHRAAREVAPELSMRLGLIARLIAKPWWLAGIAADTLAFVMQFIALGHGPLVVVQPLLVSGLLFALPLGAWVSGMAIDVAEIRGAALVVLGLAVLLVIANPGRGHSTLSTDQWVGVLAADLVPVGVLAMVAARTERLRPMLLAAAAACVYGLTAALAKVAAHDLGIGIGHALGAWEVWALIPGGVLGMVLCQSAFQAGPLAQSLPTLTAVDPVVSIAIGILAFHETVGHRPMKVVTEALAMAVMIAGVFLLGRSPLVALEETEDPHGTHGRDDAEGTDVEQAR